MNSDMLKNRSIAGDPTIMIGTKAETLEQFKSLLKRSHVCDLVYFTTAEWSNSHTACIKKIQTSLPRGQLIVRSSAIGEDGAIESMAGQFTSVLDVPSENKDTLIDSIEEVIQSFGDDDGSHQILIQPMIENVSMVGVLFTRDLETGAPYYVVNYDDESGKTDTVTGGTGVNKTVLIWRQIETDMIRSDRVRALIDAVREIESLIGELPLDVEFSVDALNTVTILQIRLLTVDDNWDDDVEENLKTAIESTKSFLARRSFHRDALFGDRVLYSEMTDWNPAEMIGTRPRPLAHSLYRNLITRDIWRLSRATMGYYNPVGEELMVLLGVQPFIDVRNSLNSFLPESIDPVVAERLVSAWLERLYLNPALHDKVEFEVASTSQNFCLEKNLFDRFPGLLNEGQMHDYIAQLNELTCRAVVGDGPGSLSTALGKIGKLETLHHQRDIAALRREGKGAIPSLIGVLLEECRLFGTAPFAIIARHAFIAESLLRGLVERGAIESANLTHFKASINTVASDFSVDFLSVAQDRLSRSTFLAQYGHLRPGTYDIRSLRYDMMPNMFDNSTTVARETESTGPYRLSDRKMDAVQSLLNEHRFTVNSEALFSYCRKAIVSRERAKFVFTHHISDILELVADWGREFNLDREHLSYLTIDDLLQTTFEPIHGGQSPGSYLRSRIDRNRSILSEKQGLKLSFLVREPSDMLIVPIHRSAPNFITNKLVRGPAILLTGAERSTNDVAGKIVCIENADPGFDWIFSQNIIGLVTQFGGANSHMTIRCAEFGIPAAIGCGEQVFHRLVEASYIEIDCDAKLVSPNRVC